MVALAAVALVGLTGCDGPDPNNLETYYDDPASSATQQPVRTPEVQVPAPKAAPVTPAAPDPGPLAERALLTDRDVVEEGVQRGSDAVSGCLSDEVSATSRTASWRYPSGSVLRHRVAAYPDRPGADVLANAQCAGHQVEIPAQAGVDRQGAWCDGKTCTVLLAKGALVSGLTVSASTEARAIDAAKRLLPAMTAKLTAPASQP
ncbi:hypothetical protein ACIOD2_04905 [Amycolatopsis sp. NPDC088138]|uniref:hypothetical protein n=1 Tax=Amycolatopsis sp. NPDC088138 TaxID=3363938 RepID=UPI003806B522